MSFLLANQFFNRISGSGIAAQSLSALGPTCFNIFAMPSRSRLLGLEVEGLGIVYLEASACGLPVLAGNSGGAPDAVVQNETGLVVDGTNHKQIAQAAIELLTNVSLSQKMGIAGRQWIVQNWRWEIWSKDFEDLLNK